VRASSLIGVALALLLAPGAAAGQRLARIPQSALNSVPWPSTAGASAPLRPSPGTLPRTYWLEGGLVGGIGLGVVSAMGFHDLCESSNCTRATLAGFLLGATVGFPVGALVGGQIRKREKGPS